MIWTVLKILAGIAIVFSISKHIIDPIIRDIAETVCFDDYWLDEMEKTEET